MNCHLAITRVKFVYLIDGCVLRRQLNRRFHNKRRRRDELTSLAVTKTHYLAYWKEDSSSEGNDTSIKGDRVIE